MIDTAPLETVKFALANEATPLFVVDASSPAIVILPSALVTSIPSPAVRVPAAKSPLPP